MSKSMPLSVKRKLQAFVHKGEEALRERALSRSMELFNEALTLSQDYPSHALRLQALGRVVQILMATKNTQESQRAAELYVAESTSLSLDSSHKTRSIALLAEIYLESEQYNLAEAQIPAVIEAYEAQGNAIYLAAQHANLALVKIFLGKVREAIHHYQKACEIYESQGAQEALCVSLRLMGEAYERLGEGENARDCYYRSLMIAQDIRSHLVQMQATMAFARICLMNGEMRKACDYFCQVTQRVEHEVKEREYYALVLDYAQALERHFEFERASAYYQEIQLCAQTQYPEIYYATLCAHANLLAQRAETKRSQLYINEVQSYAREAKSKLHLVSTLVLQSQIAMEQAMWTQCEAFLQEASAIVEDSQNTIHLAPILIQRGCIAFRQERLTESLRYFEEASAIYSTAGDLSHSVLAHMALEAVRFYRGEDIAGSIQGLESQLKTWAGEENWSLYFGVASFVAKYYLCVENTDSVERWLKELRTRLSRPYMLREYVEIELLGANLVLKRAAGGLCDLDTLQSTSATLAEVAVLCQTNAWWWKLLQCYRVQSALYTRLTRDTDAQKATQAASILVRENQLSADPGRSLI